MEKESSCGQMAQNTQEISITIILKEKEYTNGLMVECMKGNGRITKCTAKEFSLGEMECDTKETTSTTKRKVLACLNGQMVVNTSENGKMASNMVKGLL